MKIAQIVCVIPPLSGGMGMVAHSYADQLAERGHDVTLFVPTKKGGEIKNKRYKVVELHPFLRFGHSALLPQLLWKLRDFDIIHLHFPFFGATHWLVIVKKLINKKAKLIISYHMDSEAAGLKGKYFKFYKKYATPMILQAADKIIVSSIDYIENSDIQEYYFNNIGKFIELPFGVPRKFFPEKKDLTLLTKFGFTEQDTIVLFVGGLDSAHYFKGVNYLITAISLIKNANVKALIVGEGNLRHQYEELVEEYHISDRVKFSGYVTEKDLPKYYNLGDFLALPSINRAEAFGIVLLEAMACGKPLIASNLKGVRAVVDPGINGLLIEPKNSQDLADKIMYYFNNPAIVKNFGYNALQTIENKYRWSIITKKLEEEYQKLLKIQK